MLPTLARLAAPTLASTPFKRAQLGLFHGALKQAGNSVPFSKKKTRRTFLPNVQQKRLPSAALGETVRVKVTARALRTIKLKGGLDNYVLNTASDKLGWEGMRIRVAVKDAHREAALERAKLRTDPFADVERRVEEAVQAAVRAAQEQSAVPAR